MSALRRLANRVVHPTLKRHVRLALDSMRTLRDFYGVVPRECPACGYKGYFLAGGRRLRLDALCPRCGSVERHRLMTLAMDRLGLISPGESVIHFAPEPIVTSLIRKRTGNYRSADIAPGRADIVLDLENMSLPDSSVDVIVASHVLEHVDDRKALPEIHRVLKTGGRCILAVPIIEGWEETYEDPAITSRKDREAHFGQFNHVRYYGRDFRDRIRAAGFSLGEFTGTAREAVRYGLERGERIFIGTKPQ